jgi:hypothetical protein
VTDPDVLDERSPAKPARGKWFLLAALGIPLLCCGLGALLLVPVAVFRSLDATHEVEMERMMVESDLFALAHAIDAYRAREGAYPDDLQQLFETGDLGAEGPLVDPWGRAYLYLLPDEDDPRELRTVRTLGADGERGGTGADADVSKVTAWD